MKSRKVIAALIEAEKLREKTTVKKIEKLQADILDTKADIQKKESEIQGTQMDIKECSNTMLEVKARIAILEDALSQLED